MFLSLIIPIFLFQYPNSNFIPVCSYCIRQSIQYRNQCPACFAELYDNQLRPERTLDEVIRIFTSVKRKLLKRLQISYAACPGDEEETKAPDAKVCNYLQNFMLLCHPMPSRQVHVMCKICTTAIGSCCHVKLQLRVYKMSNDHTYQE